jgi:hypothetical protein
VNLVPTELNQRLAGAVQYAVAAERFYITGKSGFWRLIGLGLVCFGLGGAIGLGCYGYGQITRNTENITSLSAAFSEALSRVQLTGKADGTVQFEPHEIALAKDQTISIDPNSTLHLDSDAKVRADGEIKIQMPSVAAPPANATAPKSKTPLIANFTVFKHVPFDKGTVMTGWEFLTSKQQSPTSQYCYYTQASNEDNNSGLPGLSVDLHLGLNQKLDLPKTLPKGFDATAAFARCVWFRS